MSALVLHLHHRRRGRQPTTRELTMTVISGPMISDGPMGLKVTASRLTKKQQIIGINIAMVQVPGIQIRFRGQQPLNIKDTSSTSTTMGSRNATPSGQQVPLMRNSGVLSHGKGHASPTQMNGLPRERLSRRIPINGREMITSLGENMNTSHHGLLARAVRQRIPVKVIGTHARSTDMRIIIKSPIDVNSLGNIVGAQLAVHGTSEGLSQRCFFAT